MCEFLCLFQVLLGGRLHVRGGRTIKRFRRRRRKKKFVFRVLNSISAPKSSLYDGFVIIFILKILVGSHLRIGNADGLRHFFLF